MFASWLRSKFPLFLSGRSSSGNRSTKASRSRHECRPTLELLEDRRLLAGPPSGTGPLPAVTISLTAGQVSNADAVINWNATALRAIWTDATPPTLASRVLAMVGTAVYDAVDAIDPQYALYRGADLPDAPAPGASDVAAAIAAADTVLLNLYPDQAALFNAEYQFTLAQVPSGPAQANGLAWGQSVGNAVLAWRAGDNVSLTSPNYTPAPAGGPAGVYELTPPTFKPALTPQWGQQTPWAMTNADQFLPTPPPALNSAEYTTDLQQVEDLGGVVSSVRTADQTQLAHFWADVPGNSVTPPGHWNEIAENISLQQGLTLEQDAHLFGLLNIGLADAAINCWDAKYIYNFWRPITAINLTDPTWVSLWANPNFPSYDSGHSSFSGAADAILTSVFGAMPFTIGSDDMPGTTRSFTSFTAAANEAGFSRVVGGIHFEFDNEAGLAAGRQLGSYIVQHVLTADTSGATSNQLFVQQLYRDLLNRTADTTGLAAWSGQLSQGVSRTQIVQNIEQSVEYHTVEVQNVYSQMLGRTPEASAQQFWVAFLNQGNTFQAFEAQVAASPEYFTLHGATNAGWLQGVYSDMLNRTPDTAGTQWWTAALASGTSRLALSTAILGTLECNSNEAQSLYSQMLHRTADSSGLSFSVSLLQQQKSLDSILAIIAGSGEYLTNVTVLK